MIVPRRFASRPAFALALLSLRSPGKIADGTRRRGAIPELKVTGFESHVGRTISGLTSAACIFIGRLPSGRQRQTPSKPYPVSSACSSAGGRGARTRAYQQFFG